MLPLVARDAFVREVWTREHPLTAPIKVVAVNDGVITLADGRSVRPAGVRRRDDVTPDQYDAALRVMLAQGVEVTRDLHDGRAMLLCEPRFYNWCGTYSGWTHWAGGYFRGPLSEMLIVTAYAEHDPTQTGMTPREHWLLEGVASYPGIETESARISASGSFRLVLGARVFTDADYQDTLGALWKPPPSE